MTEFDKIFVIYNPNSTGDSKGEAAKLKRGLPEFGIKLLPTQYAGHAEELAQELAVSHKNPLIISSSGDGGYNEVVNGVMKSGNSQAVCAVLAAGNANDHARTMQHAPLLELIKKGKITKLDLLTMTVGGSAPRYAHSYIGFGLTPVIAAELNQHDLNAFKEMKIVLQRFYKYRPFKIMRRGEVIKLNSLIFANINQMAKVLTLAKENKPDDGQFEVIIFPAKAKRKLVVKIAKAATTGLNSAKHASHYKFKTLKAMPVQLDGEVVKIKKNSEVEINIAHKSLRTIV